MRRTEHKQLLRDVLAEQDLSQLKEVTLHVGLVALREHRHRRRARRGLMVTALPFIVASVVMIGRSIRHSRPTVVAQVPDSAVALTQKEDSGIKLITDDELFALFPNRSLALVGKPGHQELVFLHEVKPPGGSLQ